MTHVETEKWSPADWAAFFSNRTNTREFRGHGGGNRVDSLLTQTVAHPDAELRYGNAVQAVLDIWGELDAVPREPYEVNPIHSLAFVAFGGLGAAKRLFIEDLRYHYERLWLESPRPLTDTHRTIALNSHGQIPVQMNDINYLFEQDGWGLVAVQVASEKGWSKIAIALMQKLYGRQEEISTSSIVKAVDTGFPKLKGLRWIYRSRNPGDYAAMITERWQQELLAEGYTEEEIFLQDK